MSHANRVDRNQGEIVTALRNAKCRVFVSSNVGSGFPDLTIWSPYLRSILLFEIKDGAKPPSKQALTDAQVVFHNLFADTDVYVVNSVEIALQLAGVPDR